MDLAKCRPGIYRWLKMKCMRPKFLYGKLEESASWGHATVLLAWRRVPQCGTKLHLSQTPYAYFMFILSERLMIEVILRLYAILWKPTLLMLKISLSHNGRHTSNIITRWIWGNSTQLKSTKHKEVYPRTQKNQMRRQCLVSRQIIRIVQSIFYCTGLAASTILSISCSMSANKV